MAGCIANIGQTSTYNYFLQETMFLREFVFVSFGNNAKRIEQIFKNVFMRLGSDQRKKCLNLVKIIFWIPKKFRIFHSTFFIDFGFVAEMIP